MPSPRSYSPGTSSDYGIFPHESESNWAVRYSKDQHRSKETESPRNSSQQRSYSPSYNQNSSSNSWRSGYKYLTDHEIEQRAQKRLIMECPISIWGPSPPPSPKRTKNEEEVEDHIEIKKEQEIKEINENEDKSPQQQQDSNRSRRHKHHSHSHHSHTHHHSHSHHSNSPLEEQDLSPTFYIPSNSIQINPSSESEEEGPQPEHVLEALQKKPLKFGDSISKSEANAMAEFVKQKKRIPRRGEVGLTSEQIENFEKQGYVMSGSRHKLMNAVRLRKENEVYTAEEKRLLAQQNYEEAQRKEKEFIGRINQRVHEKLRSMKSIQSSLNSKK